MIFFKIFFFTVGRGWGWIGLQRGRCVGTEGPLAEADLGNGGS